MDFNDPIAQRARVIKNLSFLRERNRITLTEEKEFFRNLKETDETYRDSLFALFADMTLAELETLVKQDRDAFNYFCAIFQRKAPQPQQNQGGGGRRRR